MRSLELIFSGIQLRNDQRGDNAPMILHSAIVPR